MQRIDQLTERVRWLDRYRRWVAIAVAIVISPILITELADALGAQWPTFHKVTIAGTVGFVAWWVVEVGLAWLTAVWETECDFLLRGPGLPRAVLHRRK